MSDSRQVAPQTSFAPTGLTAAPPPIEPLYPSERTLDTDPDGMASGEGAETDGLDSLPDDPGTDAFLVPSQSILPVR